MNKTSYNILPATEEILKTMGEQIKFARLRRILSTELVAERAGISRASLWNVEKGSPSVAIGIYAAVLHALNNMEKDLLLVAKDDVNGANPAADLVELWKRIVFNMAVSNTDDHLRNHAFILKKNGWILSPLYDVNPVPYGDELSLNVNEYDNRISIPLAIETAYRFGIQEEDAMKIAKEIIEIVQTNWEKLAVKYDIPHGLIEDMRPAFSACYE